LPETATSFVVASMDGPLGTRRLKEVLLWVTLPTVCNTALNARPYRDRATPLNWTMTAWSSWATSTTKQNRIYQFLGRIGLHYTEWVTRYEVGQ